MRQSAPCFFNSVFIFDFRFSLDTPPGSHAPAKIYDKNPTTKCLELPASCDARASFFWHHWNHKACAQQVGDRIAMALKVLDRTKLTDRSETLLLLLHKSSSISSEEATRNWTAGKHCGVEIYSGFEQPNFEFPCPQ